MSDLGSKKVFNFLLQLKPKWNIDEEERFDKQRIYLLWEERAINMHT